MCEYLLDFVFYFSGKKKAKLGKGKRKSTGAKENVGAAPTVPKEDALGKKKKNAKSLEIIEAFKVRKKRLMADYESLRKERAEISWQPLDQQVKWIQDSFKSFLPSLKKAGFDELNDLSLHENHVAVLPRFESSKKLENLLEEIDSEWKTKTCSLIGRAPGQPSVLVLSFSAIGSIAMIKEFPVSNGVCKVGKLFAKHFKLEEHLKMLRKDSMCIAAGTPNRCLKLVEAGSLHLDKLRWIILDVSLDMKGRTLLDQPEVGLDWWKLFCRMKEIFQNEKESSARIILYARKEDEIN